MPLRTARTFQGAMTALVALSILLCIVKSFSKPLSTNDGAAVRQSGPSKTILIDAGALELYPLLQNDLPLINLRRKRWLRERGRSRGHYRSLANDQRSGTPQGLMIDGSSKSVEARGNDGGAITILTVNPTVDDAMKSVGFSMIGEKIHPLVENRECNDSSHFPPGSVPNERTRIGFLNFGSFRPVSFVRRAQIWSLLRQEHVLAFCHLQYVEAVAVYSSTVSEQEFPEIKKLVVRVARGTESEDEVWMGRSVNVAGDKGRKDLVREFYFTGVNVTAGSLSVPESQRLLKASLIGTNQLEQANLGGMREGLIRADVWPKALWSKSDFLGEDIRFFRVEVPRVVDHMNLFGVESNTTQPKSCILCKASHTAANLRRRRKANLFNVTGKIRMFERGVSARALKMTEANVRKSDEGNEKWNLAEAGAALLFSVVTVAGLSVAGRKIRLFVRILVELLDLVVGALPGYAIIASDSGLGFGHVNLTPLVSGIMYVPHPGEEVEQKGVKSSSFPFHVAQCSSIGIWQSLDRSAFYYLYIFGVAAGIVIISVDLCWHLHGVRGNIRRRNCRDGTEDRAQRSLV